MEKSYFDTINKFNDEFIENNFYDLVKALINRAIANETIKIDETKQYKSQYVGFYEYQCIEPVSFALHGLACDTNIDFLINKGLDTYFNYSRPDYIYGGGLVLNFAYFHYDSLIINHSLYNDKEELLKIAQLLDYLQDLKDYPLLDDEIYYNRVDELINDVIEEEFKEYVEKLGYEKVYDTVRGYSYEDCSCLEYNTNRILEELQEIA